MSFRKLRKGAAPEQPFATPPPRRQPWFAPPPGPPPGWSAAFGVDHPLQRPVVQQQNTRREHERTNSAAGPSSERTKILSHDEEVQRIFRVCKTAKGSAQLLRETVAYTRPEDVKDNDLLSEFLKKCQSAQTYMTTTIPWATAEAERSHGRGPHNGDTKEEQLLAELLAVNEEIMDALKLFDDLVKRQPETENARAERKLRALDAITAYKPTPSESHLVDRILKIGDRDGRGSVGLPTLHKILSGSNLTPETMQAIFDIANVEENESLSRHCIGVAVRLIGHAQKGVTITEELVGKTAHLATIDRLESSRTDQDQGPSYYVDPTERFAPSFLETSLVDRILEIGDPHGRGTISISALHKILSGSRLPPETLEAIYDIANADMNENLSRHQIGVALRLIGHAQKGAPIDQEVVWKTAPPANIAGLEPNQGPAYAGPSTASGSTSRLPELPFLTPEDRRKFMKIFNKNQPVNGYISGSQARELFTKSRLPPQTLGKIWDLADTRRQGALDAPSFTIAMYLIQACMSGTLTYVPDVLPPSLYADAARASPTEAFDSEFIPASTSISQTSRSLSHLPVWDVPADIRASAQAFFEAFDEQRQDYLERSTIEAHLKQTGLPAVVLLRIWDLSDIDSNGRLSRDEFAVAMYLIQMAERGQPLPDRLPSSLIPPARRPAASGPPSPPVSSMPSHTADLIDLDFTAPIAMPTPTAVELPAPPAMTASPPPLPPLSPLSPSSAAIFHPPGLAGPSSSTSPPPTPGGLFRQPSASSAQVVYVATGWTWDVSPADKVNSDQFFEKLDPWYHGHVEGDTAAAFMSGSKLPPEDLGKIWELSDIDQAGRLTREQFAVAMYLIRGRLAGRAIPDTLPPSLVPPANLPEIIARPLATPGPPLPARPAPATNQADNADERQPASDDSIARSATPPPPYEEPDILNIAD
ncbi:EF-hand [Trametopsis cervina]|nr:EF-hand [Trametopsis cervina]